MTKTKSFCAGFSLIEISVVIAIIGILLGSIVGGGHLLHNAKLKVIIKEVKQYEQAVSDFEEKYHYLPGDFPNATNFLSNIPNGDGNWHIARKESGSILRSLFLAKTLEREFPASAADDHKDNLEIGLNIAPSIIEHGGYWFVSHSPSDAAEAGVDVTSIYRKNAESFDLAARKNENNISNGLLNVFDAHFIDSKIDDGIADSGYVYASLGDDFNQNNGCVNAAPNAVSADYEFTRDTPSCRLHFWYDRRNE